MGNIVPLDAGKKQQIEDIAQEYLSTFATEYVLAYGAEFAKMKLKEIDEETYSENGMKKELMYRQKMKLSDPHKMGFLTKKGLVVRNWKKRYFVVNPDYTVSYYESEEAHLKASKPKGVIQLSGYKVEESADSAEVERLKALVKTLGLNEEELPLPHKYPPHTLELMHERRRSYFITAADEDDKKEWIEMFRTCCRKANGFKNEDPVAQAAFKTAYRRASGWYAKSEGCGGTEEQVLSETLVEMVNNKVLSSVYSDLSGNFTIRKKVREQVVKALDSLVLAMAIPSYKGMVESTQKLKIPLEKTINEKKDEIISVQKKITEQLAEKMEKIVTEAVKEATDDMKKMFEDLKELAGKAVGEMRKECIVRLMERSVKDTMTSNGVELTIKEHFRIFDKVACGVTSWENWYKVWNIEQEAIDIITKYKETFDQRGQYSAVYTSHDFLLEVADAAFFTFEETFKDRTKDTDILKESKKTAELMEAIKNEIIPKYDADSSTTPEDIGFKLTTMVVLEYITKKIDPLTKDIRKTAQSSIPEPLNEVISVDGRYELYVEESVKELIRKAIGISKPKQTDEERNEKKEDKEATEEAVKTEVTETKEGKEEAMEEKTEEEEKTEAGLEEEEKTEEKIEDKEEKMEKEKMEEEKMEEEKVEKTEEKEEKMEEKVEKTEEEKEKMEEKVEKTEEKEKMEEKVEKTEEEKEKMEEKVEKTEVEEEEKEKAEAKEDETDGNEGETRM